MREVEFTIMEEEICFIGKLDITGNIKWEGIVKLQTEGNGLTFAIETDYASIMMEKPRNSNILTKGKVVLPDGSQMKRKTETLNIMSHQQRRS